MTKNENKTIKCSICGEVIDPATADIAINSKNKSILICRTCKHNNCTNCEESGVTITRKQASKTRQLYNKALAPAIANLYKIYYRQDFMTGRKCFCDRYNNLYIDIQKLKLNKLYDYTEVNGYHNTPPAIPCFADNEKLPKTFEDFGGFGFENEVVCDSSECYDYDSICSALNQNFGEVFYFNHDGSIEDDNGIEIISKPATMEFWNAFDWGRYTRILADYEKYANDSTGLHIHASRVLFGRYKNTQYLNIAKLLYFGQKHLDFLQKFACRNCNSYAEGYYGVDSIAIAKQKVEALNESDSHGGRYYWLNMINRNTIEFRLFAGTTNGARILDCIKFCHYLIQGVKKNRKTTLSVYDVFVYCNDLQFLQNVYTLTQNEDIKKIILEKGGVM